MTKEEEETVVLFLEESFEGLTRAETMLLEMENGAAPEERLNALFRELHTIKGTSSFLEFRQIEALAHAAEDLLGKLRDGVVRLTSDHVTLFLETAEILRVLLGTVRDMGREGNTDVRDLVARIRLHLRPEAMAAASAEADAKAPPPPQRLELLLLHDDEMERRRLSDDLTARGFSVVIASNANDALGRLRGQRPGDPLPSADVFLSAVTLQADGVDVAARYFEGDRPNRKIPFLLLVKSREEGEKAVSRAGSPIAEYEQVPSGSDQLAEHLRGAVARARARASDEGARVEDSTVRVGVALLDQLMNLVGELVLARNQILQVANSDKDARGAVMATAQRLNIVTSELQEQVMRTRMQPIARLFDPIPRMVRNTAKAIGKEITCHVEGTTTELDRTFIELVRNPLMHIVRNALDHGIETPDIRRQAGKPAVGNMRVRAYHEGGCVNIEVEDDGGGIDPKKLRNRAIEKGLLSLAAVSAMSDREMLDIIFLPGFSTVDTVTAISGRGVGMDVVRTQVERAGGQVELTSTVGKGTIIRLKIPLTLAIVPALLVTSGGQRFAVPQLNVIELVHLTPQQAEREVEHVRGAEIHRLRGTMLPLVRLANVLKTAPPPSEESDGVNIVVVAAGDRRFGLVVESVLDTVEIVVKPMHRQLKRLTCYSGATVLGDGSIALILDVLGIAASTNMKVGSGRSAVHLTTHNASTTQTESVLVFEAGSTQCTVPLAMVSRIERVPSSTIERVGGREVLQYRNAIMPIVRPEAMLSLGAAEIPEVQPIIVFDFGRPIGLAVRSVTDIVEIESTVVRAESGGEGTLGSLVVLGKTSLALDVYGLLTQLNALEAPASARQSARVLVVDGSPMMRAVISGYLQAAGYETYAVEGPAPATAALDSAHRAGRPFAALVIDPDTGDGLGMIRRVRSSDEIGGISIIVTTTAEDPNRRRQATECGADAYLLKIDRAELETTMISLLSAKRRAA
jgi:two-component system chemotaxis sensor kinase CheA